MSQILPVWRLQTLSLRLYRVMIASTTPPEHWKVATEWRSGGALSSAHGTPASSSSTKAEGEEEVVVSLGLLRTCFSERYGSHIPRMFHDLLVDLGQAFLAAREAGGSAAKHGASPSLQSPGKGRDGRVPAPTNAPDNGSGAGDDVRGSGGGGGGGRRRSVAPVFHVTEYDVISGRYPLSWEDHAGYIIPGGVGSACGNEPWMLTLLDEVQGLRDSGRPILAFCLGHQVLAQGLGGLVQPRTGPYRHYALQESELLVESSSPSSPPSPAVNAIVDAVAAARRENGGGEKEAGSPPASLPPLRLLYHHNDEVVQLPPAATNISTSGHCEIHGMMMMTTNSPEGATTSQRDASSSSSSSAEGCPSTPNLLSFQAHPELNYEYGRMVMNGILDGDVDLGRLTHEEAGKLKEQVLAWDHREFPVALELMRRLFAPTVPSSHGGELQR